MTIRLGFFLIASIKGSLLTLMLACSSDPTPAPTEPPPPTTVPTP